MALSIVLPSAASKADERSYNISHYDMVIDIKPNGDAHIKEGITYDFYGDYNGIFRDIDLDATGGIKELAVYVKEGDGSRRFQQSQGEGQDVYELTNEDNLTKLKVYEKSSYEEKTFVFEYVLLNVAERYNDIGVFNRKVIDRHWDVYLNDVNITITIPEGAKKEELRVFAHGPLTGVSEITDERTFSFAITEIMPETFIETLAVFPPGLIPDSARVYDEVRLPHILDNEQRLADEANAERERAREELERLEEAERQRAAREARLKRIRDRFLPVFALVLVGGIYGLIVFIFRYSRDLKPEFQGDYYRELPGDYTPAIMTYLLTKGNVDSKDIMATIMDLVRNKKINIRKIETEKGLIFKRIQDQYMISIIDGVDLEGLYPHEDFLISWFLYKLGTGGSLILDDLKDILKRKARALEFQRDYETFKSMVKSQGERQGFFMKNDLKGSGIYALMGLILLISGVVSAIYLKALMGIIMAGIGIVTLVSMLVVAGIRKWTRYGAEQAAMWKAFRRFLLHFSSLDRAEIPSIVIWEHYLVYAISLGVAKEVIDQLPRVFTEAELMDPSLTYMGGYRSLGNLMIINSMLNSTTASINNAISTAAVAAPSDGYQIGYQIIEEKGDFMLGYIVAGVVVILVLYGISAYNGFVTFRNRVRNAWAQIDVQLKNRADLIPNLVETVKGYASHEKETFDQIVKARSGVLSANTPEESMEANDMLSRALNRLMVVVEAYPELKANANFLGLQNDLRGVEDKIRYSRQFYNDTVLKFNTRIQTFPNNVVAGLFGFKEEVFFRAEEGDRDVPRVQF